MSKAKTTPKVSIITCFYNMELFIEETIESILVQDYQNWELLLIDDGSTDGSTNMAKRYAAKYGDNIFYHEHEGHINKGLSSSRNVAINKSTGDYIAFLDADDLWLPDFLSHQVNLMLQQQCAMICEATEYWYSWIDEKYQDKIIPVGTKQDCLYFPPQLLKNLYPLGKGAAPCVCGILIKKNVLEKYGGFDDSFKGMYEDQVFLSKIYLHENIFISSACKNRYRQRRNSLVGLSYEDGNYFSIRKRYLDWLQNFLLTEKINDERVKRLLKKALFPYEHPIAYYFVHDGPRKLWKQSKKFIPGRIRKFVKQKIIKKKQQYML